LGLQAGLLWGGKSTSRPILGRRAWYLENGDIVGVGRYRHASSLTLVAPPFKDGQQPLYRPARIIFFRESVLIKQNETFMSKVWLVTGSAKAGLGRNKYAESRARHRAIRSSQKPAIARP